VRFSNAESAWQGEINFFQFAAVSALTFQARLSAFDAAWLKVTRETPESSSAKVSGSGIKELSGWGRLAGNKGWIRYPK
jgi:hypothetical protein